MQPPTKGFSQNARILITSMEIAFKKASQLLCHSSSLSEIYCLALKGEFPESCILKSFPPLMGAKAAS